MPRPLTGESDLRAELGAIVDWVKTTTELSVVHDWPPEVETPVVLVRPLSLGYTVWRGGGPRSGDHPVATTRLLVTVLSPDPEAAAVTAGLLLEALDERWTVEPDGVSVEEWQALCQHPVPAFALSVSGRSIGRAPGLPIRR